jgi:ribosomal protein S2
MKTKKFKFKQLLKLHLLKARVYEHFVKKINFNDLTDANLDQLLVGIKKALQVIFQYNQTNKRILFIGLPSKLESKINSTTRHIAVSSNFNVQGLISNNNANLPQSLTNKTQLSHKELSKILLAKLTKRPDLIILFNHKKSEMVFSEAWVAKIPVVAFIGGEDSNSDLSANFYSVNGNFKNSLTTSDQNIFFVGLNFLFKNLKKKKTKFPSISSKTNPQPFSNEKKQKARQN